MSKAAFSVVEVRRFIRAAKAEGVDVDSRPLVVDGADGSRFTLLPANQANASDAALSKLEAWRNRGNG